MAQDFFSWLSDSGGADGKGNGQWSSIKGNKKQSSAIQNLFSNPIILQAMLYASQAGQNPFNLFKQFSTSGDLAAAKAAKGDPSKVVIGKGKNALILDIGKLAQGVPELAVAAQAQQIKAQGETYKLLKEQPQFAGIFGDAEGNFGQQFTSDINKGYEQMANSALGTGAKSGFLADPNKQAQILGPLALQKGQYLKGIQVAQEQQALGLSGAAGLTGSSTIFNTGIGGASQLWPAGLNANAQFMQGQQFNQQMGFQKKQQQDSSTGAAVGLLGSALYAFCWVAEELYGADDPRTHCARLYATTHTSWFLELYRKHGRAWASWLAKRSWAKPFVRPIWDRMARLGERQLWMWRNESWA